MNPLSRVCTVKSNRLEFCTANDMPADAYPACSKATKSVMLMIEMFQRCFSFAAVGSSRCDRSECRFLKCFTCRARLGYRDRLTRPNDTCGTGSRLFGLMWAVEAKVAGVNNARGILNEPNGQTAVLQPSQPRGTPDTAP